MKIIYFLFLLSTYVFYILDVSKYALYVTVLVFSLPIIFLIVLLYQRKRLKVDVNNSFASVNISDPVNVEVVIHNKSIFPIVKCELFFVYVNNFNSSSDKLSFKTQVFPRSSQLVQIPISFEHCGNSKITLTHCKLTSFFSLFNFKIKIQSNIDFTISPEVYPIELTLQDKPFFLGDSEMFSSNKSGDDPSEVFEIREYIPGDKLNKIHWKISSKQGSTYVKDFSLPINPSTLFLLDVSFTPKPSEYSDADCILSGLISILASLSELDTPSLISWYSLKHNDLLEKMVLSSEDIGVVIGEILSSNFTQNSFPALKTFTVSEQNNGINHLVYLTNKLEDDVIDELHKCDSIGLITVIFVGNNKVDAEKFKMSDERIKFIQLDSKTISSSLNFMNI